MLPCKEVAFLPVSEMTTREAAKILGVSRRRVGQLIEKGALTPLRRFGRVYVLDSTEVERYAATVSGTR